MKYRIAVGGCRYYNNYDVFCEFLDECFIQLDKKDITILSGKCSGVDNMAERYAIEKGYDLETYPAEWNKFGKSAGPKRNRIMAERADLVMVFWDYKSKGTKNLIEYATKFNKPVKIKDITPPTSPSPHLSLPSGAICE